jgi:hypothetical protein
MTRMLHTDYDQTNSCGEGCRITPPASRRRRRKGNPVPGGTTGPPCSWRIQIRGPGPPGSESLEFEKVKCSDESRETQT